MRGLPALLVLGLLAGCAGAPPSSAPVHAAAVAPSAAPPPPANATSSAPFDAKGTAAFSVIGACAPAPPGDESCLGASAATPGKLSVPRNLTRAKLTLTWDAPLATSYHVHLGNRSAVGTSPLALDLPGLPAGSYEIQVFPDGVVGPTPDQAFAWELREG